MSSCKKSEAGREQPPDKIKLTPLAQRDLEAIYIYGLQHFDEESARCLSGNHRTSVFRYQA
ncbi:hypothetical protein PEC301937_31730 [Pectobacterium carotovorum subsp. carotovorum]|nr:hypothetical protein PEC301937_31730 [Pectobacterium carotovorum subsp. carotovorum]